MTRRKTSFSISSPSSKLTISLILYTVIILRYNTIIKGSSKWFVSTCGMKANSPLTTLTFFLPRFVNRHVVTPMLFYLDTTHPCSRAFTVQTFLSLRHSHRGGQNSSSILVCKILNAWASEFSYVWRGSMWTKSLNARISHGRKFVRCHVNVA